MERKKAMLWNRFDKDKPFLDHFKNPVMDSGSGIEDMKELKAQLIEMEKKLRELPRPIAKGKMFQFVVQNIAVGYNPRSWFGVNFAGQKKTPSDKPLQWITVGVWQKEIFDSEQKDIGDDIRLYEACGISVTYADFEHSVPDWEAIFRLGFPGLLARARNIYNKRLEACDLTPKQDAFYQGVILTLEGCLMFIRRLLDSARSHIDEDERMEHVCRSLEHVLEGRIEDFYDALQLNLVYYMIQHYLDCTSVRSLGNLDQLLYPYYQSDIVTGRYTREQIAELLKYYMINIDQQGHLHNQPFYIGGTAKDETSRINELSYLLLDVHDQLGIISPKLFLKIAPNTPDSFAKKALDMIRRGHSSIVFINEELSRRSLRAAGATEDEARDFLPTGCFEIQVLNRENMTCVVYTNLVKCLEYTLSRGYDRLLGQQIGIDVGNPAEFKSFDDLFEAWKRETIHILGLMADLNNRIEAQYTRINPTSLFSSTNELCIENGIDGFDFNGVKYNTSEMLMPGMATLTDSLYILKKYVFDLREITLAEFCKTLEANWSGYEALRTEIINDPEKYGNDLSGPDEIMYRITSWLTPYVNSLRNSRGGSFKSSFESIYFCLYLGEKCAASPNGRRDGELISKNLSSTIGQDRRGITSFLKSVTKINTIDSRASAPVDFALHPSAVQGSEGLEAMLGLLRGFMKRGGLSLQGNVINVDTLRDAQAHPEQYETLQVRVCGWNWYFNNMSRREQDWFIKQCAGEIETSAV